MDDIDADGDLDLVVHIIDTDGTYQPGEITATLNATTYDGFEVEGSDTICVVP